MPLPFNLPGSGYLRPIAHQTYKDRLDESLGMRRGPERDFRQSMADRRNESIGASLGRYGEPGPPSLAPRKPLPRVTSQMLGIETGMPRGVTVDPLPEDPVQAAVDAAVGGREPFFPRWGEKDTSGLYANIPYDGSWWRRVRLPPDVLNSPERMHAVYMEHGHPDYQTTNLSVPSVMNKMEDLFPGLGAGLPGEPELTTPVVAPVDATIGSGQTPFVAPTQAAIDAAIAAGEPELTTPVVDPTQEAVDAAATGGGVDPTPDIQTLIDEWLASFTTDQNAQDAARQQAIDQAAAMTGQYTLTGPSIGYNPYESGQYASSPYGEAGVPDMGGITTIPVPAAYKAPRTT